jgi:nucleotide-binding universal stress UspA family protein
MRPPDRILVALDESAAAWRALNFALRRAAHGRHEVTVLTVLDSRMATLAVRTGPGQMGAAASITGRLEGLFERARAVARLEGVAIATQMTASTDPAGEIVNVARAGSYDEVVVGHREKRGLERMVMGSTALRVLEELTVPVTIVH